MGFLTLAQQKSQKNARCSKIAEKVSFHNISQSVLPDIHVNSNKTKKCWKMPKFEKTNETFWMIFKQCATVKTFLAEV